MTSSMVDQPVASRRFRILLATATLLILLSFILAAGRFNRAQGIVWRGRASTPTSTIALPIFQSNPPTDNFGNSTITIQIPAGSGTGVGHITITNIGLAPLTLSAPYLKLITQNARYH